MNTNVLSLLLSVVLIQAGANILTFENVFKMDGATCEGSRYYDVTSAYEKDHSKVCGEFIPSGAVALYNYPPFVFIEKCMLLIATTCTDKRLAIMAVGADSAVKGVGVYDPNVANGRIQNSNAVCRREGQENRAKISSKEPPTVHHVTQHNHTRNNISNNPSRPGNGLAAIPPVTPHTDNTSSWFSDHGLLVAVIIIVLVCVIVALLWLKKSGHTGTLRDNFQQSINWFSCWNRTSIVLSPSVEEFNRLRRRNMDDGDNRVERGGLSYSYDTPRPQLISQHSLDENSGRREDPDVNPPQPASERREYPDVDPDEPGVDGTDDASSSFSPGETGNSNYPEPEPSSDDGSVAMSQHVDPAQPGDDGSEDASSASSPGETGNSNDPEPEPSSDDGTN